MRSGAKSRMAGVVVSVAAILVTLLVAEAALRLTHAFGARLSWYEPDPVIGYRFTPGRHYWSFAENDHPIEGRINSFGWRDRSRTLEKPPGAYRVAFLGDSFVEAFQVETDSTFIALAEDALTSRFGRPVEILNFGRSGATQTEELLLLRSDVMAFSPDLVAVLFIPENDIGDVARGTAGPMRPFFELTADGELKLDTSFSLGRAYEARAAINGLKQRSALVSLLTERYNLFVRARRAEAQSAPEEALPWHLTLCTSRPDPNYRENYGLNKVLLSEMAAHCGRAGARFLLVCGEATYLPEDIEEYTALDPTFDPGHFERDLPDLADSLGIEYLGLHTPFREHAQAGGGPLRWGHYNYAGHRLVAGLLGERLAGVISEEERAVAAAAGEADADREEQ